MVLILHHSSRIETYPERHTHDAPQPRKMVGAWVHGYHRPPPVPQRRQCVGAQAAPHVQQAPRPRPLPLAGRLGGPRLSLGLPAEGRHPHVETRAVGRGLRGVYLSRHFQVQGPAVMKPTYVPRVCPGPGLPTSPPAPPRGGHARPSLIESRAAADADACAVRMLDSDHRSIEKSRPGERETGRARAACTALFKHSVVSVDRSIGPSAPIGPLIRLNSVDFDRCEALAACPKGPNNHAGTRTSARTRVTYALSGGGENQLEMVMGQRFNSNVCWPSPSCRGASQVGKSRRFRAAQGHHLNDEDPCGPNGASKAA